MSSAVFELLSVTSRGKRSSTLTDGASLCFDTPDSSCTSLIVLRNISTFDAVFEVRVTHPDHITSSPREGLAAPGGEVEVALTLEALDSLDVTTLRSQPIRVMISATAGDGRKQKTKLVCDEDSVLRCIHRATAVQDVSSTRALVSAPADVVSKRVDPTAAEAIQPLLVQRASHEASVFSLRLVLHSLTVPHNESSVARISEGSFVCVQWKRGSVSGNSPWFPVGVVSPSAAVWDLSQHEVLIEDCRPPAEGERRIVLLLGIVSAPPGAKETQLRGTLKLDASRPVAEPAVKTTFPVVIDGCCTASLCATLDMTASPGTLSSGQLPSAAGSEILKAESEVDVARCALNATPPPSVATDAPARASPVPVLSPTAAKRDPASLVALRSHLEALRNQTPASPKQASGGTSTASSPSFVAGTDTLNTTLTLASPLVGDDNGVSTNPLRAFEKQQVAKSSNVFVAVRIRPMLPTESASWQAPVWAYDATTITSTVNRQQYQFDAVFPPTSSTVEVYDRICPTFVENAISGINGTIFMYGQTASGKTYTMFGASSPGNASEVAAPGLTQMVIKSLFAEIEQRQARCLAERSSDAHAHDVRIVSTASYFEIYNEELNDLLDVSKKNLQIRSSGADGFTVDVSQILVRSADEALQVLLHGSYNKKIGQSHLNDRSSRSHSIFKISIEITEGGTDAIAAAGEVSGRRKSAAGRAPGVKTTTAELCLVDLAGSETLQEKSGTSQRKETTNINLSLTYLKKVIWELAHKEKHVSYRNSALTKVLKQAIGGNSRTCVVCCMTPAEEHFRDSRNTLVFGTTAKSVVTNSRVNTTSAADSADVERLRKELSSLRLQLEAYEATVLAYSNIEDDFTKTLEINARLEEQVLQLETENSQLRSAQTTSASSALMPPTNSESASSLVASNTTSAPPVIAPRFSVPARSQEQETLRANAEEHAALLEEAISRLADATMGAGEVAPSPASTDRSADGIDQSATDEAQLPEATSVGGTERKDVDKKLRPPAPLVRPASSSKVVVETPPRLVEKLQLQLIQQAMDYRRELAKKDEEIQRLSEQQLRPTDEIPEIMKKEEKVCLLLDQLHNFLHHGTPMTIAFTGESSYCATLEHSSATSTTTTGLHQGKSGVRTSRVFMYLYTYHQKETFLCFCLTDETNDKLPKRSSCFEKIAITDIKRVELGQYSDNFEKIRVIAEGEQRSNSNGLVNGVHPTSYIDAVSKVRERRRMSFTVVGKKGRTYDCVCEDEADFEAWVIELNRLIGASAEWKRPLDINDMEFFDVLSDEEKKFCSTMHIFPDEYIRAKTKMLKRKEKFVTLFDVRALAQFDLYHSQRFFYFLRCQNWVSQAALFYLTDSFLACAQPDLESL